MRYKYIINYYINFYFITSKLILLNILIYIHRNKVIFLENKLIINLIIFLYESWKIIETPEILFKLLQEKHINWFSLIWQRNPDIHNTIPFTHNNLENFNFIIKKFFTQRINS